MRARDAMLELGMACDGGKDSLSMAASAGGETVKAPGNLVVSAYVPCPDITATVTPDLKLPGAGRLLHVDLAAGRRRLGGSNLAQAFSQVDSIAWHSVAPRLARLCVQSMISPQEHATRNMQDTARQGFIPLPMPNLRAAQEARCCRSHRSHTWRA